MLNNLPLEVILHITTFLPFGDKTNLVLTCKKLFTIIFNNTLHQELHLECYGTGGLRVFFERFKNKELNGHQVRQLFIRSTGIPNDIFRNLALVFPNVTEVNDQIGSFPCGVSNRTEDDLNSILAWKDTLQRLHIRAGYSQLPTLIEKNVFPHLKYLSMSPYQHYTLVRKSSIRLFRCLKNAPSLTHLRLYNITIHIKFLEKLHARFPQLESLTLGDLIIYTNKDAKITSVEPATRLLSLKLEMENIICDARCLFLDYIVAKYTNLKRLSFSCLLDENWLSLEVYSHYLEEQDDSDDDEDTDRNERMLISAERDHNLTRKAYSWEGSSIFSKLPSTLEELKIDTCIFEDVAEALESADIQPRKLDFHPDKSDSVFDSIQEIQFFQKWTSLTSLEITVPKDSHLGFGCLISDSVTRLKIYLPEHDIVDTIFINRILASFPAVENLKIGNDIDDQTSVVTLCIDEYDDLSHAIYPNLRVLYLKCSLINSKLPSFLADCTPNLKELSLDLMMNSTAWTHTKKCHPSMPILSICMQDVNLDKLNISVGNVFEECYLEDSESEIYVGSRAYLEVTSPAGSSIYILKKDLVEKIIDLSSTNDTKEDELKKRVQIKLVHAGNIKEVTVGNHMI